MLTETTTWRAVSPDDMPDADLLVNVAIDGGEEPVWLGAFDGEVWRDTEGMQITVTHWAPMLVGPAGAVEADECGTCRKALPTGCNTEFQGEQSCALTHGVTVSSEAQHQPVTGEPK